MMYLRYLIVILSLASLVGCSKLPTLDDVIPDKRKTYRKSRDLPDLEVPPDLTTSTNDAMRIPGEEESTSLTEFERQRALDASGGAVLGKGEFEGEQWIALQGTSTQIWPELQEFWSKKGFVMDLDDAELGVMETDWKEEGSTRSKFRIFTEPSDGGGTILFVSSEQEEGLEGNWLPIQDSTDADKEVIRELNLHFYGTAVVDTGSSSSASESESSSSRQSIPRAEILDIGEGKLYLAIPQEFTLAWHNTEKVLGRAGYTIEGSDQAKGIYNFRYFKPAGQKEKKGLLDKLKFWGDDEDTEGTPYQLSLTGVGDKTEAIIMDDKGEWVTGEIARPILDNLRNLYNQI